MRIATIGCGVMGSAITKSWRDKHSLFLYDVNLHKAEHLAAEVKGKAALTVDEVLKDAEVVLLAIKPGELAKFAGHASTLAKKEQLWISILAGTPIRVLKTHLPTPKILRMMPNLALLYKQGIIGLVEDPAHHQEDKKTAETLLKELGMLMWLPESKIDAFTSLTSSGPAFILVMLEAFIEGGVSMGLTADDAKQLAIKTFSGSMALASESGKALCELKLQIASPGGMTIAGLNALDISGVKAGIIQSLLAAYNRAKEMTQEHQK